MRPFLVVNVFLPAYCPHCLECMLGLPESPLCSCISLGKLLLLLYFFVVPCAPSHLHHLSLVCRNMGQIHNSLHSLPLAAHCAKIWS